jgi:hypothetical protein
VVRVVALRLAWPASGGERTLIHGVGERADEAFSARELMSHGSCCDQRAFSMCTPHRVVIKTAGGVMPPCPEDLQAIYDSVAMFDGRTGLHGPLVIDCQVAYVMSPVRIEPVTLATIMMRMIRAT